MREFIRDILIHWPLVSSLVRRQLAARYRGSLLGLAWTFLNPLFLMLVYALVFSIFVRDASIEHYATYVFCGLLPWLWFSQSLLEGANAIVGGGTLITKALFPAQILPAVSCLANLVNFLATLLLLVPFLIGSGRLPGHALLALPVVVGAQFLLIFALVAGLSAINVHYRDVQHVLANVLQLWFFLSPILYSAETAKARHWAFDLFLVKLNPIGILTQAYHDVFYWNRFPSFPRLGAVALLGLVALWGGIRVFDGYRDTFAEEI